jgi:methylglutaconyl-CoA hydratase
LENLRLGFIGCRILESRIKNQEQRLKIRIIRDLTLTVSERPVSSFKIEVNMKEKLVYVEENNGVATIWLNRPDKRNAFNNAMILELLNCIEYVNQLPDETIVLLRGKGSAFCAGADLKWMQDAAQLDYKDNFDECLNLAKMLLELYNCNKVTLAVVHGAAYGGGVGLASACDIVIADETTKFSLSELRIGIVAASISPYLFKKLGESRLKELVYTASVFNGSEALAFGLVNNSVPLISLEKTIKSYVDKIKKGAPKARSLSKKLIHKVVDGEITEKSIEETAEILAKVRVLDEAKERIGDFLKKV